MCVTCAKINNEAANNTGPRLCQNDKCGIALRPAQKGRYCDQCDKGRQTKWVTQDALERKLKEAEERASQHQEKLLKEFQHAFFSQMKGIDPGQATVTKEQGQKENSQKSPNHQPSNLDEQEQELLDYEETRSMYGRDHGHFDSESITSNLLTPDDSVSQIGSVASRPSGGSAVGQVMSDRVEMIQRISDLVEPTEQVKDDVKSDAMKQTFGSSKAYVLHDEKKRGISLSSIQKALLDKHLYPKHADSVPAFSSADAQSIPVDEDHFHNFKSPQANKELLDYISIVRQKNDGSDKATPLAPKT